jgi:hypothetical protein
MYDDLILPTGYFADTLGGYFFDSIKASEYNNNKSVIYTTSLDSYIRDGWVVKKDNRYLTQIVVHKDTLITCKVYQGGTYQLFYTYVYVRDTSIQLSELPVERHSAKKADISKINISFNKMTSIISFNLPQRQRTSLFIFDLTGRMVMKCLDQTLEAGSHQIQFKPKSFSGNTYICKINAGGTIVTKQFTLLK